MLPCGPIMIRAGLESAFAGDTQKGERGYRELTPLETIHLLLQSIDSLSCFLYLLENGRSLFPGTECQFSLMVSIRKFGVISITLTTCGQGRSNVT